ncbi:hypothetical protein DUNSADRAFT_4413 [Dunaliella salina]|uniref:Uncharacterized protein n=1 Tax=Dunaliella salina TaxID=3046 RepID=A0ABQ7GS88_DUNSA|nr:hypothetical protein DUNSADRAFT_4413 [Dunaliella salina]|eukprot:KAF5837433.1 hypothetical protein DUNSADRAFT_4413 [Dunaliella salina]
MKSQNGSLSHLMSENGSFSEDTSPSDSKGGTSKGGRSHGSHANRIIRRVASSIGKSFTSSTRSRGKLGLDSDDDSDSQGGNSPEHSRPQILPYTSFNDAANRALLGSARKGDLHGVKEALDQNADPNLEDYLVTPEATNMGMTPLHYIAACGRQYTWEPPTCTDSVAANITRLLLQHGARKHPKDRVRYTPLHCAVEGQQPEAVVALLQKGASCTIKDYTSFTPWNLAATHMSSFAFSLIAQLNIALAQDSRLPADAVMRLALEMRYLEAVPVVLRATAKCPQQVWALMRTAIASGLQEFAELLAEDIPTVCPRALLQVPWGDVMVELATRFPECFKILIHGLDYVDFDSIVLPFIQGLNFDADPVTPEVPGTPALPPSSPPRSPSPSSRPNIAKLLSNKSGRSSKLNRVKPEADTPTMSPSMNLSMRAVGGGLDSLRSNTMDRSFSHLDSQHKGQVGCGKGVWSTLLCRADDEDLDDGFEEPEHAGD